jgi:hypothetical protein
MLPGPSVVCNELQQDVSEFEKMNWALRSRNSKSEFPHNWWLAEPVSPTLITAI